MTPTAAFAPERACVAFLSGQTLTVRALKAQDDDVVTIDNASDIVAIALASSGVQVAWATADGTVTARQLENGRTHTLGAVEDRWRVFLLAFTPTGRRVVADLREHFALEPQEPCELRAWDAVGH